MIGCHPKWYMVSEMKMNIASSEKAPPKSGAFSNRTEVLSDVL